MGCLLSKSTTTPSTESPAMQKMLPLVRPEHYKGKRPSFQAAYARAANRYGFETGRNAGFAKRNGVVVKVKSKHDQDTKHEVPATSIQNGAYAVHTLLPSCRYWGSADLMPLSLR